MGEAEKPRRLFVGTFLPAADQDALGALGEYRDKLSEEWQRKVRCVRGEKLHLTWMFLGAVDPAVIPQIESTLDAVLPFVARMELAYAKPTFWPSPKHARMLVLTPNVVPNPVVALADKLRAELNRFAEKPEHDYRPHITLMRFDGGRRMRLEVPDWFPLDRLLPMHHSVERIDLIESHLGGSKDYESIRSWSLK